MQERRICCENCKYALDENFHGHFCPQRKAAKFCHPDINIIDFESVTQLQGKKILSIHLCDTKNEEKENHLERTLQEVSHSNHRSLKVEWHPVCGAPFIVPPLWISSMTHVDLWDNPYVHFFLFISVMGLSWCLQFFMLKYVPLIFHSLFSKITLLIIFFTFRINFLQALFWQLYREHFQLTVWGQNAICTSESLCSNFVLIQIATAKCKLQTAESKIQILNPSFTVPCHFQFENEENKFLANKKLFHIKNSWKRYLL